MEETTAESGDISARYYVTDTERVLTFSHDDRNATVAQNVDGYAMLMVRRTPDGEELERYYGFDAALDHVAELLDVEQADLPIPDGADELGM